MLYFKNFAGMFIFCFLLLAKEGVAQMPAPTLKEIVEDALRKDYGLANSKLDVAHTQVEMKQLKEAYLPRIEASAKNAFLLSSFKITSPEISIPHLNIDIQEGYNRYTSTANLLNAGVGASVLLYSGGKVPQLKKALNEKVQAQTVIMEKDRQEIIGQIMAVYDHFALLDQAKRVLDESAKRLAENKRIADKALEYGLITKYEHQKIEIAQAQLAAALADYEGKKELVIEQLHLLTDIEKERLNLIANNLIPMLIQTSGNGIENRSELKALLALSQAAQHKIKAENTWFVPKIQAATSLSYVGLLAGHLRSSEPVLPGGNKLSSDLPNLHVFPLFNVGIGLKWDLFDGNTGRREVEKATLEWQKIKNEKSELTEKLELNLTKCYTDYKVALAQINLKRKEKEMTSNALKQATGEYRVGLIRSSQLVDAEEDYQKASLGYVQAIYDQRRAAVALRLATGDMRLEEIQ